MKCYCNKYILYIYLLLTVTEGEVLVLAGLVPKQEEEK